MAAIEKGRNLAAEPLLPGLDFTGYAQEFLRRNLLYREQYVSLSSALAGRSATIESSFSAFWNLIAPFNPDLPAWADPAIWLADAAPMTVVLEPSIGQGDALTLAQIAATGEVLKDFANASGRHLIIATRSGFLRVWVRNADGCPSYDCRVLTGPDLGVRVDALRALQAAVAPVRTGRIANLLAPSRYQRSRLDLMIRTLDHLATCPTGALVRSVARHVTFPHSKFRSAAEWKGSSERRQTQRWIHQARSMVREGYLELLKGRIPSQDC